MNTRDGMGPLRESQDSWLGTRQWSVMANCSSFQPCDMWHLKQFMSIRGERDKMGSGREEIKLEGEDSRLLKVPLYWEETASAAFDV